MYQHYVTVKIRTYTNQQRGSQYILQYKCKQTTYDFNVIDDVKHRGSYKYTLQKERTKQQNAILERERTRQQQKHNDPTQPDMSCLS